MGTILPPLTPVQMLAVYRVRYPAGLACTACGRLLATTAPARLTEAERLAYVCAECRLGLAEAERVRASKAERARKGAQAAARHRVGPGRHGTQAQGHEGVTLVPSWPDPVSDYGPKVEPSRPAKQSAEFQNTKSDAEHRLPLAHYRRRGGWAPSESRAARYRRRNPARAAADLRRLRGGAHLTSAPAV